MQSVVKAQGASVANRALSLWVQTSSAHGLNPGILADAFLASYQILSADGTQVFPAQAGGRQPVDLDADRVDVGWYCAHWDSSSAAVGAYLIQWFVTPVEGDDEVSFSQDFEVVMQPFRGVNYCSLSSLRDEGVRSTRLADAAAQRLILQASRYVDMFTGRTFCPQVKTLRVDGTNGRGLVLDEPIVAISGLAVSLVSQFTSSDLQVLADTFRVYNRHLTLNLLNPDDRENPRLEFVHDDDLKGVNYVVPTSGYRLTQLIWPKGQQNCRIEGIFGYTEPDGSFVGRTPELIQLATRLFCFRYLDRLGSNSRDDAVKRPRILSEHTKDQGYTLAHPATFAGFSGDPEIDSILAGFSRSPRFGAV